MKLNIMTLLVIGIIAFMFMRKKKNGLEPSEPAVSKIGLGTGTIRTAVMVKGAVKVSPETIPRQKVKCPTGYMWSVQAQECRRGVITK